MSRVATALSLAVLFLGGALVAISLSPPGDSTTTPLEPSVSSLARPFEPDDGVFDDSGGTSSTLPEHTGSTPTAVHLPTVSAVIRPVGINPDGSMEVPDDPREVGWYTLTNVKPGDEGTAVIAGHVDSRTQGKGAFFGLSTLSVGDEIVLETKDGPQYWTVSETKVYLKSELPIVDVFSLTGEPRLALITCGGEFDQTASSYRSNIIVYAHQNLAARSTTT